MGQHESFWVVNEEPSAHAVIGEIVWQTDAQSFALATVGGQKTETLSAFVGPEAEFRALEHAIEMLDNDIAEKNRLRDELKQISIVATNRAAYAGLAR